jgi:protein-disulfide isomerase
MKLKGVTDMVEMKREHIVILALTALVVGYVAGRAGTKGQAAAAPAHAATAAASPSPAGAPAMAAAAGGTAATASASAATTSSSAATTGSSAATTASAAPAAPAAAPAAPVALASPAARPTPPPPTPSAGPTTPPAPAPAPAADDQVWKVTVEPSDPSKGPADAKVTVVVFSAFGCQECIEFAPAVDRLLAEYGDKVRVVFKQKVFDAPSPDALVAAEAALAAHAQGKFWEMRAKLFGARFSVDRPAVELLAAEIGLDMARFKAELAKGTHQAKVLRDSLMAYEVGAHSFPNVLANGVRMPKPKNFDSLRALVDAELAKADRAIAAGTPAAQLHAKVVAAGKTFPQLGPPTGPTGPTGATGAATLGPAGAKVTMVVFEDFECPFCARASANLKQFASKFPKGVRFVFKHFPLASLHANAQLASEAAVEAQAQGKFWQYHDKLFANQKALERADLERYAQEVGLDLGRFKAALDSRKHQAVVERDLAEGQRAGVSGTPTVFLNGRKYQGPRGYNPLGLEAVSASAFGL